METKNNLTREILNRIMKDKKNNWKKKTDEYLTAAGIRYKDIKEISKNEIKKKVNEMDTRL